MVRNNGKMIVLGTIIIVTTILLGFSNMSIFMPMHVQKTSTEERSMLASAVAESDEVTISTPSHGVFPSLQTPNSTVFLELLPLFLIPATGEEIAVWNPPADPLFTLGCPLPGESNGTKWQLKADTNNNGDFMDSPGSALVSYNIFAPDDFIRISFGGEGGQDVIIQTLGSTASIEPDLPSSQYAWVDNLGNVNNHNTSLPGLYKLASCGTEGFPSGTPFLGGTTFLVVDACIKLEKDATPLSGSFPLLTTYTYRVENCGAQALKDSIIVDLGEDANNDGILSDEEDKNNNEVLDSGCTSIVSRDDDPGDNDDILESNEIWVFTCVTTLNNVGIFNNTAFVNVTICDDVNCLGSFGSILGDPACESSDDLICDDQGRDDAQVEVLKRNSAIVTQSNPSSITLGGAVTDKATVRSVPPSIVPAPTGTVKFFLCTPAQITEAGCPLGSGTQMGGSVQLTGTPPMATSAPVNSMSTPNTNTEGTYCWRAEYSGDGRYNPSNHNDNGAECFQVGGDGTIIIKKRTVPEDPQDFSFTHNITSNPAVPSPFKLDDHPSPSPTDTKTFFEVPAGSYRVTETIVLAIPLQSIVCVDPTGDSFRTGNAANIELDAGETVTCTFSNGIVVPSCETGTLPEQPEDAISMTSIRSNSIVKTIHAEKQVFNCQLPQGSIPVIADVTIIAEIYQDINTKTILSKQVEVVTCIKNPATIRVLECNLSIPSTDRIPVTNCQELEMQHPQEMNTIRKGSTAKTIETQKEVFTCSMNTPNDLTDDKKVDLVLFTEIYQNLNTLESPNITMLSMKCVIKIDTVQVESCQFRQVNS